MKKISWKQLFEDVIPQDAVATHKKNAICCEQKYLPLLKLEFNRAMNTKCPILWEYEARNFGVLIIYHNSSWNILEQKDLESLNCRILLEEIIHIILKRHLIYRFRISEWKINEDGSQIYPERLLNIIPFGSVRPFYFEEERVLDPDRPLCDCKGELTIDFTKFYEKDLNDYEMEYTCKICKKVYKASDIFAKLKREGKI